MSAYCRCRESKTNREVYITLIITTYQDAFCIYKMSRYRDDLEYLIKDIMMKRG